MSFFRVILAVVVIAGPAVAEVPRVVADIPPVHALVARVMQGLGSPDLIIRAGASPHGYTLRPSAARALQDADLVVWIGPELTPWLVKPLTTLAADAAQIELLGADETRVRQFRDPDHDAGPGAETGDHDHDHDHDDGVDPHVWLDPENARIWLGLIAEELARIDPEHSAEYRANAIAEQQDLLHLDADLAARLTGMRGRPFITFHDAYQYFESRYGLTSAGTITASDATDPSPGRLSALRDTLRSQGVTCAFSEPQFDSGLIDAAGEGLELSVVLLDPMGGLLAPGPGLYPNLLNAMADAFASCSGN